MDSVPDPALDLSRCKDCGVAITPKVGEYRCPSCDEEWMAEITRQILNEQMAQQARSRSAYL